MEEKQFENQVDSLLDLMPQQASPRNEPEMEKEVVLFSESGVKLSPEEILYEFMGFMRNLPIIIKFTLWCKFHSFDYTHYKFYVSILNLNVCKSFFW